MTDQTRKRPRRECPVCHKNVALYANGLLWLHYRPGWGIWTDPSGQYCKGSGDPYSPMSVTDYR